MNTKQNNSAKKVVFSAMFTALTLIATYVIKIPTPTLGYIHIGDSFVILSSLFLGPLSGPLAAGLGSALSDLLGGYAIWVPGTFIIKFLSALTCAALIRGLNKISPQSNSLSTAKIAISGVAGELVMIVGYFFYNIIIISLLNGSFNTSALSGAITESAAEIPFNIVQGTVGIILALILAPLTKRIVKDTYDK
ncbi:MAG: ECF transporter S component [Lachnospiraceae bacterium]|nr:ECF transporter S component [Lachnospiraceae bacterium]